MLLRPLVTGATGFVGRRLMRRLERPVVLSRSSDRARQTLSEVLFDAYDWNATDRPPPLAAFDKVGVVYHLAGESIADGRWTPEKKRRLRDSRIVGTRHLVEALAQLPAERRPRVLVSASAVGYYGSRGDELLDESSPPGNDFLAEICVGWEEEALRAAALGMRVVVVRIGVVLGRGGGALQKMLFPFRMGAGSPLGTGRQWMPWIHLDDLVSLFLFAGERSDIQGPVNGVAPHPVTNREFTKTLAKAVGMPAFLPPVPVAVLKAMLGDMAEILVVSQRAVPRVAQEHGFRFEYPTLLPALRASI